jgi:hypothetical protein
VIPLFEEERRRLTPLLREAESRHAEFKTHWNEGTSAMGWKAYKATETYRRTLDAFHEARKKLESTSESILTLLRKGDRNALSSALAYLSIRHRPFRSGYVSQQFVRALKKFSLGEAEKEILRRILIDRMTWLWAQSRELWGLMRGLETPAFNAALEALADHPESFVRDRIRRVLPRKR